MDDVASSSQTPGKGKNRVPAKQKKKKKEKRNPNFGKDETEMIFRETGKRARMLVNRHGPGVTEEKKKRFWKDLAKKVTVLNGNNYIRTADQVKKKWQTTRSSCKAKVRLNINEKNKTGGGQAVQSKLTGAEELFLQNIPIAPENIHGIPGAMETNKVAEQRKPKTSITDLYSEIARRTTNGSSSSSSSGIGIKETVEQYHYQPDTMKDVDSDNSYSTLYVPDTQQMRETFPLAASSPKKESPIHGLIRNSLRVANSIGSDLNDSSASTILEIEPNPHSVNTDSLLDQELREEPDVFVVGARIHTDNYDPLSDADGSNVSVFADATDDEDQQQQQPMDSDNDLEVDVEPATLDGGAPRTAQNDARPRTDKPTTAEPTEEGGNLGPIRSNRTVTRDIRRQEFKALIDRKDKMIVFMERQAKAQEEICKLLQKIFDKLD